MSGRIRGAKYISIDPDLQGASVSVHWLTVNWYELVRWTSCTGSTSLRHLECQCLLMVALLASVMYHSWQLMSWSAAARPTSARSFSAQLRVRGYSTQMQHNCNKWRASATMFFKFDMHLQLWRSIGYPVMCVLASQSALYFSMPHGNCSQRSQQTADQLVRVAFDWLVRSEMAPMMQGALPGFDKISNKRS